MSLRLPKLPALLAAFALVLALTSAALADPMTIIQSSDLRFELGAATKFVRNTRTDPSDTIAIIPVNLWSTTGAPTGTISTIQVVFKYKTSQLTLLSMNRDPTNWPAPRSFDSSYNSTALPESTIVSLTFNCNNCMTLPTVATTIATVSFSLRCQPENNTNNLKLLSGSNTETYVTINRGEGTTLYNPAPEFLGHGRVTSADYTGTFSIHDTTFTCGKLGETFIVPVYARDVNFRMEKFQHRLNYDSTQLQFIQATALYPNLILAAPPAGSNPLDFIGTIPSAPYVFPEITTETPLYSVEFKAIGTWDSTQVTFDPTTTNSYARQPGWMGCANLWLSFNPLDYRHDNADGKIYMPYTAKLYVTRTGSTGTLFVDNASISYSVTMANDFPAGADPYNSNTHENDRIRLSFDRLASGLTPFSNVQDGQIDFERTSVDNDILHESFNSLETNPGYADYMSCQSTPGFLFSFTTAVNPASMVINVDDPVIRASILDYYTIAGVTYTTHVIDTTGRMTAVRTGTSPKLQVIVDPIPIAVGQLFLKDGYSTSNTVWDSLFIKNPIYSVKKFSITIRDAGGFRPLSFYENFPGISWNRVDSFSIRIHDTVGFNSIGATDTLLYLGKIPHAAPQCTKTSGQVPGWVTVVSATITNTDGRGIFVDKNYATLSAPCYGGGIINPPLDKPSEPGELPLSFALYDNYPNPFNPETQIAFDVPRPSHVTISVFNIMGQLVATVADENFSTGHHIVTWRGTDQYGTPVSSGIYLYRMEAETFTQSRKMLLVK